LVYADLNGNGVHDAGEPSTLSAADGTYSLRLAAGSSYTIRSVVPPGFRAVAPNSNSHTVNVTLGGNLTNRNFGLERIQMTATGRVWDDTNGNGFRDPGEPGVANRWVYIDLDNDCRMDIGEPSTTTGPDGTYTLLPPGAGTFTVRQVLDPGQNQTFPAQDPNAPDVDSCSPIGHIVTLTGNPITDQEILTGLDFGNRFLINNSTAAPSYGAASHGFVDGLHLGPFWDVTDGVEQVQPLVSGSAENRIQVRATNTTGQPAYLNAWMDFDGNGSFGAGEKIFDQLLLPAGVQLLTFSIPQSAQLGSTVARFRYSHDRNLGPTGFSSSGEVEDYTFNIVDSLNLAVDDTANVTANSALNSIDVLANDFLAGPSDVLSVIATSGVTSAGGQAVVSPGQDRVLYTPPAGFIGTDTFTYTMQNSFGQLGTASVVVSVNFFFENPQAVDDSFEAPTNSVAVPLNVLANDIEGQDGALSIISITQPSRGGQVTIATGGKSLRYTPAPGFGGTEVFTYTATDAGGNFTSANVTVHTLPGARLDDEVLIQFVATDMSGNPISAVEQGRDFKIQVIVDDLRFDSGNPGVSAGVFAAYFDLLYSAQLVSLKPDNTPGSRFNFDVDFFNGYVNFTTGDASVPGVIDEFGATSSNFNMQEPDPLLLAEITFTARSAGIVDFIPDPADLVDQSDTLLFNIPGSPVPIERIRYMGTQIQIFGDAAEFPFAVDDSVPGSIPVNSPPVPIDVLANDLPGSTGNVSIASVTQGSRGSVFIVNRNGNPADPIVTYTPNTNFQGFDQFTYTIQDSRGISSTATVSVRVGDPSPTNLIADFELVVTDLSGQPIEEITVGSQFQLRAFVQDARPAGVNRGLFTAYMDVLFSSDLVSPVLSSTNDPNLGFVVSFGPTYNQVREGDVRIPGLINEIGAQSSSPTPVGSDPFLLFTVTMTANSVGLADFIADPADISPFHDTLTYSPAQPVLPQNIGFGFDQLRIVSGSSGGSGEFHNSSRPLDVNNDGYVSAIDALLIINHLNGLGPGTGEGEASNNYYPDTNGDGRISAIDALMVVNHLNERTMGSGEGEASSSESALAAPPAESNRAANDRSRSSSASLTGDSLQTELVETLSGATVESSKGQKSFSDLADQMFASADEEESSWDALLDDLATDVDQKLNSGL
jgi:large repetitive protein